MNAYPVAWINGLDVRTTVDDRGFESVETVRVDVSRPQGVGAAQVRVGELVLLDTRLVRVEGDDAGAVVRHHRHARLSRRLEPCPDRGNECLVTNAQRSVVLHAKFVNVLEKNQRSTY